MVTVKTLIEGAMKKGIGYTEAYYLCSYVTGASKEKLYTYPESKVGFLKLLKWILLLNRRLKGVPLSYIIGEREFYSLKFRVKRGVLIPRPETELLVDYILKIKPRSLLDLGTGSGVIAIAVKYNLPECVVYALDISRKAVRVAKKNSEILLGRKNAIRFIRSSFCTELDKKFDVVVSNPPYIPEVTYNELKNKSLKYEPKIALYGGRDGLSFYREILSCGVRYLIEGGVLIFEISDEIVDGLYNLIMDEFRNFDVKEIKKDYAGHSRMIVLKFKG